MILQAEVAGDTFEELTKGLREALDALEPMKRRAEEISAEGSAGVYLRTEATGPQAGFLIVGLDSERLEESALMARSSGLLAYN